MPATLLVVIKERAIPSSSFICKDETHYSLRLVKYVKPTSRCVVRMINRKEDLQEYYGHRMPTSRETGTATSGRFLKLRCLQHGPRAGCPERARMKLRSRVCNRGQRRGSSKTVAKAERSSPLSANLMWAIVCVSTRSCHFRGIEAHIPGPGNSPYCLRRSSSVITQRISGLN